MILWIRELELLIASIIIEVVEETYRACFSLPIFLLFLVSLFLPSVFINCIFHFMYTMGF